MKTYYHVESNKLDKASKKIIESSAIAKSLSYNINDYRQNEKEYLELIERLIYNLETTYENLK